MTARDDARAKCIEAMASAMFNCYRGYNEETQKMMWEREKSLLTSMAARAFDSLNGIVTVNLPEATAQMIEAAVNEEYPSAVFRAMSTRGNLTNPPERTP